jgi:dTMP kinase
MRGKFIVLEGGDGSGKSTFFRFLKEKHPEFVYSREPGGIGFSEKIRDLILLDDAQFADPLTMFNLFWASKVENVAKVVRSAFEAGQIIVTDRFEVSTYAYQVGENYRLEKIFWAMRAVCLGNIAPIYLNFDVPVDVARSRIISRGDQNHYDKRNEAYRNKVRFMYKKFFEDTRIRSYRIDANLPMEEMLQLAYSVFKEMVGL